MTRLVCAVNGVPSLTEITIIAEGSSISDNCVPAGAGFVSCDILDVEEGDELKANRLAEAIVNEVSVAGNLFLVKMNDVDLCNDPLGIDAEINCEPTGSTPPTDGIRLFSFALREGLDENIDNICTAFITSAPPQPPDAGVVLAIVFGFIGGFFALTIIISRIQERSYANYNYGGNSDAPVGTFKL